MIALGRDEGLEDLIVHFIGDAVAVDVHLAAVGDVALVGDSVAVAVLAGRVVDVALVGDAVAVAIRLALVGDPVPIAVGAHAVEDISIGCSIVAGNVGTNASGSSLTQDLLFAINHNNAFGVAGGTAAANPTAAMQKLEGIDGKHHPTIIEHLLCSSFATGQVSTRENSWHDLFNALVWCRLPQLKVAMNAVHYQHLEEESGGRRGKQRDALTLLDESGVIVNGSHAGVLEALAARDWQQAFVGYREAWAGETQVLVCGHAHATSSEQKAMSFPVPMADAPSAAARAECRQD